MGVSPGAGSCLAAFRQHAPPLLHRPRHPERSLGAGAVRLGQHPNALDRNPGSRLSLGPRRGFGGSGGCAGDPVGLCARPRDRDLRLPRRGSSHYSLPDFDGTAFRDRLRGGIGNGVYVNCSDCATIVASFANALGCELWESKGLGICAEQFAGDRQQCLAHDAPACASRAGRSARRAARDTASSRAMPPLEAEARDPWMPASEPISSGATTSG